MKKAITSITTIGLMLSLNLSGSEITPVASPDPTPPVMIGPHSQKTGTGYKWVEGHWKWAKEIQKYVWINPAWVKVPRKYSWIQRTWQSIPKEYRTWPWGRKTKSNSPGSTTPEPAPNPKPSPEPSGGSTKGRG